MATSGADTAPKKFIGKGFFSEQGLESDTTRWAEIYQGFLRHD
ncbi:hypothetical protein HDEF_1120 [Candidatus Hamiltonella defensa 5AT (Acyrthosiphon pisum)]|uniref:Uncharacterized protein n=1 Tax=Hamiltonella defensa subsp. Acyrthosiphon pisum (strain 5AT) TaxID=572265 RepID=C4K5E8_HAMD5|nr:hypothetical protein HDEF_1120 [Candidatus Hamiltonella defensa 5AT (Acyrthosiphon pisum)]